MQLRCAEGDLAIILKEDAGCEVNVGRIVRVRGPIVAYADVGPTWLISPLSRVPWAYRCRDGEVREENASGVKIEHPDAWMTPIRDKFDDSAKVQTNETDRAAALPGAARGECLNCSVPTRGNVEVARAATNGAAGKP